MSDRTHIIEIDRIVLTGADLGNPDRLNALIEAEVRRALSGSDLRTSTGVANSETRVAGEVARTVVRSVQGGSDGV
jgi:Trm5-related predicted tRNA methylase